MASLFDIVSAAAAIGMTAGSSSETLPLNRILESEAAQGVWVSDGYGILLEIVDDGRRVRTYDFTDISCVETSDAETHFSFAGSGRVNSDGETLVMRAREDVYEIAFQRVEDLPESCDVISSQNPTTALDNFDVFVRYFSDHFAFFEVHNPEWMEQAARFRNALTTESRDGDIIEPMIALLSTLKDGHVSLRAVVDGDEGEFIAFPGPTLSAVENTYSGEGSAMAAFGQQFLRVDIEQNILDGQVRNAANERIKFGVTSDDIGYLAIMAMGGYTPNSSATESDELKALDTALDEVFTYFADVGVKAVLIDLSVNRGGFDFLSRALASRFVQEQTLGLSKYAGDAQDQTPQPFFIEPTDRPGFVGPTYVLTSDVTVSAAETLVLALRASPNTIHIGARTRGALSDVLEKRLPNGWTVTLSNEVYLDHHGVEWEGVGIEPDHEWPVFDPTNPFAGHLAAVERAIALIDAEVE